MLAGLTDGQKRALRLADNKIALGASWDLDLLKLEFGDLADMNFDLGLTWRSTMASHVPAGATRCATQGSTHRPPLPLRYTTIRDNFLCRWSAAVDGGAAIPLPAHPFMIKERAAYA